MNISICDFPQYTSFIVECTLSKKSSWTLIKVQFSQNMLHITQIESLLCEEGECPLHFDTKLEGIG